MTTTKSAYKLWLTNKVLSSKNKVLKSLIINMLFNVGAGFFRCVDRLHEIHVLHGPREVLFHNPLVAAPRARRITNLGQYLEDQIVVLSEPSRLKQLVLFVI